MKLLIASDIHGSAAAARALARRVEQERPDLIVAHFMTFSLGVIVPMFAQRLKVPVVLWSMKEPVPPAQTPFIRSSKPPRK